MQPTRQKGDQHYTKRTPEKVKRGVDSHAAKLNAMQIAEIQSIARARPKVNRSWLARSYGVSRVTIWRYLKDV